MCTIEHEYNKVNSSLLLLVTDNNPRGLNKLEYNPAWIMSKMKKAKIKISFDESKYLSRKHVLFL